MTCNCQQQQPTSPPCGNPQCGSSSVYTPNPCNTTPTCSTNELRLYVLRCGTWVYGGSMSTNSAPTRGMRILWEDKAYTVEQATLIGSEPMTDKWEVMLIAAGPSYSTGNPCMPCQPPVQPPLPPPDTQPGGVYVDNPCGTSTSYYPGTLYPNTPRPVEVGLGCGPHYTCNGLPPDRYNTQAW